MFLCVDIIYVCHNLNGGWAPNNKLALEEQINV